MKQPIVIGLLIVAVVALIFTGRSWRGAATRKGVELVQAQERYSADSAASAMRVAQLEDSLKKLGRMGDSLRAGWAVSREASAAGLVTIRNLIAQLPAPARDSAAAAVVAIIDEQAACSLVVINCEARAGAERSGRLEALARLWASDSLRTATSVLWVDAERRARPSFFRDLWRAKAVVLPSLAVVGVCLAR